MNVPLNGTKSTIGIVILANMLKCFGYCLMMEQIPICGQLIPFAVGVNVGDKLTFIDGTKVIAAENNKVSFCGDTVYIVGILQRVHAR